MKKNAKCAVVGVRFVLVNVANLNRCEQRQQQQTHRHHGTGRDTQPAKAKNALCSTNLQKYVLHVQNT